MNLKIIKFDNNEIEEYKSHQYKSPILISDLDINEIIVSNEFLFGKQDFKYFIGFKNNQEMTPLCIFFPEMSIYKRYSDKTKCMYFMIKGEKNFDKYVTILEKVSNIIKKKLIVNLNKKYINAGKRFTTKESFHCFYMPVILFDQFIKKMENIILKYFDKNLCITFLEKYKKF